jgi:hypothetical protein
MKYTLALLFFLVVRLRSINKLIFFYQEFLARLLSWNPPKNDNILKEYEKKTSLIGWRAGRRCS